MLSVDVIHSSTAESAVGKTEVTIADSDMSDEWDAYVDAHQESTFFHKFGWSRIVHRVYGFESIMLCARDAEKIIGVLPLINVNTPLMGRAMISMGFTVGGGPIAATSEINHALISRASEIGEECGVKYVEIRSDDGLDDWIPKKGIYAGFKKALHKSNDENLLAIPRKRRADIRKALQFAERGAIQLVDDRDPHRFYPLYANALRDLGTPVFPYRFIEAIVEEFGNNVGILTVEENDLATASLVSFYFKDTVLPYFIAADNKGRRESRLHDLLYWTMMQRGTAKGAHTFDFGRSKVGSGAFAYKKLWGIDPSPITYRYKLIRARGMPNVNPENPRFSRLSKMWRHLPTPVASRLGPVLAPNFA